MLNKNALSSWHNFVFKMHRDNASQTTGKRVLKVHSFDWMSFFSWNALRTKMNLDSMIIREHRGMVGKMIDC